MSFPFTLTQNPTKWMFLGDLGILICSLLWAVSFSAVKFALEGFTPLWILTIRFAISLGLLTLLAPKTLLRLTRLDWLYGLVIGGSFTGALLSQALGLKVADSGLIAFLTAGYVALLPFMLWLCRRRPYPVDFIAAACCFAGMALLTLAPGAGLSFGLGTGWGLASAFFAACQVLSIELFAKKSRPLNLCFTQLIIGGALSLAAALILEGNLPDASPAHWAAAIYLALGCTLIPFFIQLVAQPMTTPTRASLIYSLESVFAGFIGVLWLGEQMTGRGLLGCGLIFGAVLLAQLCAPTNARPKTEESPDLPPFGDQEPEV